MEIKKRADGSLIWRVESSVSKNSHITVHEGCQAIEIRDGQIYDKHKPGKHKVNIAGILSKGAACDIYAVNTAHRIKLPFAAGTLNAPIEYMDKRFNALIKIRTRGEVVVTIEDPRVLLKQRNALTVSELEEDMRQELSGIARSALVEVAGESDGYVALQGATEQIGSKMAQKIKRQLDDTYGLVVEKVDIVSLDFPNAGEFTALLDEGEKERLKTIIAQEQANQAKAAADAINAFSKQTPPKEDK